MGVTLYSRPYGPICYQADLFRNEGASQELTDELLSSGLNWYWASARSRPLENDSEFSERPAERLLTPLVKETARELVEDFLERDVDDYGRTIVLFGADRNDASAVQKRNNLELALKAFSAREEGPIQILLVQVGDSLEFVYAAPHHPVPPVLPLLDKWGIVPANITAERKYQRLNLLRLETGLESILDLAFGTNDERVAT